MKTISQESLPTIADVAKASGTTITTVSRVLNNSGYVHVSKRTAVLEAVEKLHYIPNANARVLKTRKSRAIGLVIGDLLNPYSVQLAHSIQTVAVDRGYTTFVASASEDVRSELAVIESFQCQRLAGMIVATLATPESDRMLARLAGHKVPVVVVGRNLDHPGVDAISANHRRGGALATQHLLDLGHRRIAFIGAELGEAEHVGRLRGYLDAMEAGKLRVKPEYVLGHTRSGHSPRYSTKVTGYQATQTLLRLPARPTAIFARNDHTATGVIQALQEAGLRVPEDVSVAGFDNIPLTALMTPTLTTVSQPTEEQGRLAAEFLLSRLESSAPHTRREVTLDCHLIVRASTAAPRASR
jgi:DNA-binding LacI/PurR family transcriptional regulator